MWLYTKKIDSGKPGFTHLFVPDSDLNNCRQHIFDRFDMCDNKYLPKLQSKLAKRLKNERFTFFILRCKNLIQHDKIDRGTAASFSDYLTDRRFSL